MFEAGGLSGGGSPNLYNEPKHDSLGDGLQIRSFGDQGGQTPLANPMSIPPSPHFFAPSRERIW